MRWIICLLVTGLLLVGCNNKKKDEKKKEAKKPSYTDMIPRKEAKFNMEKPGANVDYNNSYGSWATKVNGKEVKNGSAIKTLPKKYRVNHPQTQQMNNELDRIKIESTGMKTWDGKLKEREDIVPEKTKAAGNNDNDKESGKQ